MCNANMDVPDAPWVRMAETYGAPYYGSTEPEEDIHFVCPVCGAEDPEDFVVDRDGDVIGCDCCCRRKDAYEFTLQKRADERLSVW